MPRSIQYITLAFLLKKSPMKMPAENKRMISIMIIIFSCRLNRFSQIPNQPVCKSGAQIYKVKSSPAAFQTHKQTESKTDVLNRTLQCP